MEDILERYYMGDLKQLRDVNYTPTVHYHIKNQSDLETLLKELNNIKGKIEFIFDLEYDPEYKTSDYTTWKYFDSGIRYWLHKGKRKPIEKFYLRKITYDRWNPQTLQQFHVTWEYQNDESR